MEQKSPALLQNLPVIGFQPRVRIQSRMLTLQLFRFATKAIMELGELEHSGDWDPYLCIIYLKNKKILTHENPSGYYEFSFGQYSEDDQDHAHTYYAEAPAEEQNIVIFQGDDQESLIIPIMDILSIYIMR